MFLRCCGIYGWQRPTQARVVHAFTMAQQQEGGGIAEGGRSRQAQ
jgi:hypothetical protein